MPSSNRLPFRVAYLCEAAQNVNHRLLLRWANNGEIVHNLRRLKHIEVDCKERYALLGDYLNGKNILEWPAWESQHEELVQLAVKGAMAATNGEEHPRPLRRRLVGYAVEIIEAAQVPGAEEWPATRNYTVYCFQVALGLILQT